MTDRLDLAAVRVDPTFWRAEPLAPIRLLADLRHFVLERSHTRLPRWHFRLARDLVLRIQPKPAERRDRFYLFLGEAFAGEGLTREACAACASRAQRRALSVGRLVFGITASDPLGWAFRPRQVGGPQGHDHDGLRARVLATLRGGAFDQLRPEMMLAPACLICGKRLTDPVSIARWIGPECAGTGSLDSATIPLGLRGVTA